MGIRWKDFKPMEICYINIWRIRLLLILDEILGEGQKNQQLYNFQIITTREPNIFATMAPRRGGSSSSSSSGGSSGGGLECYACTEPLILEGSDWKVS